jgi:ubiquinone/menaquinone biosynthesis C-methylase UbiE
VNPLKQRLNGTSGGRILDVATGRGGFIVALIDTFESYDEIIGIDSSEKLIDRAKEKCTADKVHFQVMKAENMDFPNDSFDTVAISNSLHHLVDANTVLFEIKRVLKTGGLLIVCEMYQNKKLQANNPHVMLHHWFAEIDRMRGITHNKTFRKPELMKMIENLELESLHTFEHTEPKDNQLHKEEIDGFVHQCDKHIEKLKEDPKQKKLVERGEAIKQALINQKFNWAPQLYMIGKN